MWFWRLYEPEWLSGNKEFSNPSPYPSKSQKAFRTAPWVSAAGGREKKSLRRGLNPESQNLFRKLLVDKSCLIFLGRTLEVVFAACR